MGKIQVQNAWGSPIRDPQSILWSVPQLPLLLVSESSYRSPTSPVRSKKTTCLWTSPIPALESVQWRKKMMVVLLPLLPPKRLLQNQNSCQATRHPAPDPAQLTINQQRQKKNDHLPTKTDEDLCIKEEQTCIPTIKKRVLKPTASNSAPA